MASQRVTLTTELLEHKRENLQKFIEKGTNFSNKTEQDEARKIYLQRLKDEKELKGILKQEFKTPLREVTKGIKFDYKVFKITNDENVLTQSIQKQFDMAPGAAWDYFTLKRSKDLLDLLKKKEDKDTTKNKNGKATRLCAQERFGKTSAMLNKEELRTAIIQVTQEKGKDEQMDTSEAPGPSVSQSQDVVLNISAQVNINPKCLFCNKDAVHYCYECKSPFCKGCRENHDKLTAVRYHTITEVKSVDPTFFRSSPECDKHNAEFVYYCKKCRCLICSKCVTTSHNKHDITDIKSTVEWIRSTAVKEVADAKGKLQRLSESIVKVEDVHIPKLEEEAKSCTNDIYKRANETVKELQKIVDTMKDIKLAEVEYKKEVEMEELESSLSNKRRVHRQQVEICTRLENLLNEKHDVSFYLSYQKLKTELLDLSTVTETAEPHHIQMLDPKAFLNDVLRAIASKYNTSLKT